MLKSIKCDQAVRAVSGFSLVELTLALGIAAFCLIAVIGIIPVGVQTNRNATSQTAATNIMAAVVSDVRATSKTKFGSTQFGVTIPSNHNGGVAPNCQPCSGCWNAQTQTRYFDGSGKLVASAAALYRITLTLVQNPTATTSTGALFYDVRATWPAQADPCATTPSGSAEMFAAFDRN
jgi:type II secretory pathway pseudopilin PulG